jgi:prepilin-type N-terminal cleavage/methylation domain-containing protein
MRATNGNSPKSGFTLVELLVVIAIIGALAGLLAPNIINARRKADQVKCLKNMQGIGQLAISYSEEQRNRGLFPFGKGKNPLAYESLQVLVDAFEGDVKPEQFICPESLDVAAEADADGKFLLSEDTCSYAYVATKMKNTAKATTILLCDDSVKDEAAGVNENHAGGVNVFYVDNSAKFLYKEDAFPDTDLPAGLIGNSQ